MTAVVVIHQDQSLGAHLIVAKVKCTSDPSMGGVGWGGVGGVGEGWWAE